VLAAVGQSGKESLIDGVGPGWSPADCSPTGEAVGTPTVCFAPNDPGSDEWLVVSASTVATGVDPRLFVEAAGASMGGEEFDTPGLDVAEGRTLQSDGQAVLTIVMFAGGQVFNLILVSSAPPAEAQAFLLTVARRQQDEAGGTSVSPVGDEVSADEIDRLLLAPPPGSGLEVTITTDMPLELEHIRPAARSQAVVDVLSGVPSRVRIFSTGGLPVLIVTLDEYPYPILAASALGTVAELPSDRLVARNIESLPNAVAFRMQIDGGTGVGIALRKGPFFVLLVTPAVGLDEDAALTWLEGLAIRQADLLPEGETVPYFFPSVSRSIAVTVGFTTLICGGAFGAGRISAARGRHRRRSPPNDRVIGVGSWVVEVTERGSALRRRGLVLAIADLVAVNVIVVGTLGITEVLQMPAALALALIAAGSLAGIAFTARWARSELGRGDPPEAFAAELRPSVGSVVGGVVGMALLVVGLATLAAGLAGLAFGPSLSGLERSKRLGVDPALLSLGGVVVGVLFLVLGGFVVRLARVWARATARRLRARDPRPPILYLRSFEDDDLRIPTIVSARRPFLELFAARGSDSFEESIAWQLAPFGPVIAVGRPGRSLRSLGAARDHLPDDVWRERVSELMTAARAIVTTIGSTDGLRWEVARLVAGGHLPKTLFVLPPAPVDALRDRWRFTANAVAQFGLPVPDLPVGPKGVLAAVFDRSGVWRVAFADVRDEATYRVALDQGMDWIIEGDRAATRTGVTFSIPKAEPALPPPP
jgi:hypothetical protein